jgi:hypothetical protein
MLSALRYDIKKMLRRLTFHDQLMRPRNQRQAVVMVEGLRDILAERVAGAAGRYPPPAAVVGVGPEEVAHRALVRDLLHTVDGPDVVQGIDRGGQTAVQTEDLVNLGQNPSLTRHVRTDLVLDKGGEGEAVEEVGKEAPDVRIPVLTQALVVETIHLRDLPGLVVPTEDGDAVGVAQLERHEEGDGLDGVVAAVDVVAHEQVVRVRRVSADSEELGQVVLRRVLKSTAGRVQGSRAHVRTGRGYHRRR